MLEMFKKVSMLALVLGIGAASASLNAQVQSTIVLKNGQRHTGRHLDYRVDRGEVSVRVGLHEQPRVRVDQVAYVDFGDTPDVNVQLSGSQNAVVMRDGSVIKGQIIQLGHETSDDSSPFLVIFRTSAGEERRVPSGQVARVYFSASPVATTGPEARGAGDPGRHRRRGAGQPAMDANGPRRAAWGDVLDQRDRRSAAEQRRGGSRVADRFAVGQDGRECAAAQRSCRRLDRPYRQQCAIRHRRSRDL
jgi:hypothetical protein